METAIVGVIGALIGVLVANAIKLVLDVRDRAERVRDIQTALRAEIRSHRRALEVFLDDDRRDGVVSLIMGESQYSPFIPSEVEAFVFKAVLGEIHLLPGAVIDPVVLYYRQWHSLAALASDMRSEAFSALPPQRKAAVYEDYMAMGAYADELARDAAAAINGSLGREEESV